MGRLSQKCTAALFCLQLQFTIHVQYTIPMKGIDGIKSNQF